MNKIRFEVVAHRAHSGMLAIFVKCSQYGSSIELDTDVRVFNDEWNEDYGLISKSPNAANLNLLIRKLVYSLEEIELTYAGEMTQLNYTTSFPGVEHRLIGILCGKRLCTKED